MKSSEVIKRALGIFYKRDLYTYALGAQGETIEQYIASGKLSYYYPNVPNTVQGFRDNFSQTAVFVYDCSGFVNYCIGKPRTFTSSEYFQRINSDRVQAPAGSVLVKSGHVGIDVGYGYMLHFPKEGHTCELVKSADASMECAVTPNKLGIDVNTLNL